MNILVISQFYYPEPFRITDICEELHRRGHKLTVICALPNYPKGEIYEGYTENAHLDETVNGVRVIRCSARPRHQGNLNLGLSYLSYVSKANKMVKKLTGTFDVVFVYQLSPVLMGISAGKAKKKFGIPEYLYCLDIWPESIRDVFKSDTSVFYKTVKRISASIYRKADKIGVTSPSFINYLHDICGIDDKLITYLPQHAEDTYLSIPEKQKYNSIIHFAFMGNMSVSQNLPVLIQAATLLDDSLPFHLDFIGNGPEEPHLKKMVSEMGLSQKVTFHGRHPLEEMPAFYEMADVCFVSLQEDSEIGATIPGKLQGYMAAGKPVLAAISGPTRDLIVNSRCGLCVAPNDVAALSKAMETYLQNMDKLRSYGRNGRAYFKSNFSCDIFVSTLEQQLCALTQNCQ